MTSAKSNKLGTGGIRAEIGSTTPKEREEQHSAAQRRIWRGVPAVHATAYRDDDGNEIIGSRGDWMLLAGESVCGPFRTLTEAKQYVEDNDV